MTGHVRRSSTGRPLPTSHSGHEPAQLQERMDMLLENKNAVIYGGGGSVGGAVARAFAREGAKVFLAGRTMAALDERAIEEHIGAVAAKAGGIDVSFNAISIRDVQGIPLVELSREDFSLPIVTGTTTHFLTARAAARRMVERGSGVILTLSASAAPVAGSPEPGRGDGRLRGGVRGDRGVVATAADAGRGGQCGGLHGLRSGQRDDGNHRQPDVRDRRRLAPSRPTSWRLSLGEARTFCDDYRRSGFSAIGTVTASRGRRWLAWTPATRATWRTHRDDHRRAGQITTTRCR